MTDSPTVAVLIATYRRAHQLGATLDAIAESAVAPQLPWEVVVVDNNSGDDTAEVVRRRQHAFPVPLRYFLETTQGRSAALNTAIAQTAAPLLLFTDDDVRVESGWLQAGADALAHGSDYVGGPVFPLWEVPPPTWVDLTRSDLWGTLAILDYGREPFSFEDRQRVPLGANMGVRRSLIDRVGGFRRDLGRTTGRRLLGQEVPELLARARAAGLRGRYIPEMAVHHHVPASRLTKQYFRRWWLGKGYAKAIVEAMSPVTELGLNLEEVPHIGALPRYMFGDGLRAVVGYARAVLARNHRDRFRHEMRLAYLMGFVQARGLWRRPPYGRGSAPSSQGAAALPDAPSVAPGARPMSMLTSSALPHERPARQHHV